MLPISSEVGTFELAHSDWVRKVLRPLGTDDHILFSLQVPARPGDGPSRTALTHLAAADDAYNRGDDATVLQKCYAVFESLRPRSPETLFESVSDPEKRQHLDKLMVENKDFLHAGRHVAKEGSGAGQFDVDHRDSSFALAQTKIWLAYLGRLLACPQATDRVRSGLSSTINTPCGSPLEAVGRLAAEVRSSGRRGRVIPRAHNRCSRAPSRPLGAHRRVQFARGGHPMPIRPQDVEEAADAQLDAARDTGDAVRLVAGPGTGKSVSIEERFRWLLEAGVELKHVYGVSFTRAAARDLRLRATKRCHWSAWKCRCRMCG